MEYLFSFEQNVHGSDSINIQFASFQNLWGRSLPCPPVAQGEHHRSRGLWEGQTLKGGAELSWQRTPLPWGDRTPITLTIVGYDKSMGTFRGTSSPDTRCSKHWGWSPWPHLAFLACLSLLPGETEWVTWLANKSKCLYFLNGWC